MLELVDQVLDAPDEVKARFADADKAEVVLLFTLAPLRKMMAEVMAAQAAQQETTPEEEADEDN